MVVQAEGLSSAVAYVAAGGRSRRMGRDKALLPWEGATLLDHALARLRAVCDDVRILCGPSARYEDRGARVVLDRVADGGPLAGLHAALADAAGRPALLLAVDLPFVPPALLARLCARLAGSDAVVPVAGGLAEPLCAAYGPACLAPIGARLAGGERRMTSFWPDVAVLKLGEDDLAPFGDPRVVFRNLNTPQDIAGGPGLPRDKRRETP